MRVIAIIEIELLVLLRCANVIQNVRSVHTFILHSEIHFIDELINDSYVIGHFLLAN